MTLSVGDKAPGFYLVDQRGERVSLADYEGRWLLVWWIPSTLSEMTPMCCDHLARGFGDAARENPDVNVVGISFDTREQMRDFAQRSVTTFPLLSDVTREVGAKYGTLREGDWDCFPKKRSFLINPKGVIARIYTNIDPDFHVEDVKKDLEELGAFKFKKKAPAVEAVTEAPRSFFKRLVGK